MSDDLASAYLPAGVVVDDVTRHVAAQLALAWLQLTPAQRRLVLEYERCLDPVLAAKAAGLHRDTGESALAADRVRLVLRLRSTLLTDTIPPAMIGRVLTRIALGIDEGTPHARIRAAVELARVQGAYVPPSHLLPKEGETGEEVLDQAAQDRIVAAAMQSHGMSFADQLRTRVAAADAEAQDAQAELARQAEVASATRQAAEQAQRAGKRRRPTVAAPAPSPVVDAPLAPTDALVAAMAKLGRPAA